MNAAVKLSIQSINHSMWIIMLQIIINNNTSFNKCVSVFDVKVLSVSMFYVRAAFVHFYFVDPLIVFDVLWHFSSGDGVSFPTRTIAAPANTYQTMENTPRSEFIFLNFYSTSSPPPAYSLALI